MTYVVLLVNIQVQISVCIHEVTVVMFTSETTVKSLAGRRYLLGGFSERHSDESVRHRLGVYDVLEAVQIIVQPRASVRRFTLFHTISSVRAVLHDPSLSTKGRATRRQGEPTADISQKYMTWLVRRQSMPYFWRCRPTMSVACRHARHTARHCQPTNV